MRIVPVVLLLASALVTAACETGGSSGRPRDRDRDEDRPRSERRDYDGPDFRADIVRMESHPEQWAGIASVTVRSGGHRLLVDETSHDDGNLDLRLTLQRPARDEMTTQALEELTVRHPTGARPIRRLRVFVRITRRGERDDSGEYLLAATSR